MKFNIVINYIFKKSFQALKFNFKNKKININEWSDFKDDTYLRMNKFVFRFVSKYNFKKQNIDPIRSSQFLLDILTEIISDHYKIRQKIYNILKFNNVLSAKNFIIISHLFIYYFIIKKGIFYTLKNLKTTSLNELDLNNKIIFTIGMPQHAFSINNNEDYSKDGPFYSFGEYFKQRFENKYIIYSLNEYVVGKDKFRPKQFNITKKNELDRILLFNNLNLRSRLKEKFLTFYTLSKIFIYIFFNFKKSKVVDIFYELYKIITSFYYEIFSNKSNKIEAIFTFSGQGHLGLIPYNAYLSKKLIYYSYSQNYCEQPTIYMNSYSRLKEEFNINQAISEINPDAWKLDSPMVGFTEINSYLDSLRKIINKKFSYKLKVNYFTNENQIPVMIGYKSSETSKIIKHKKTVAFFDAPPETTKEALLKNFVGWPLYDLEFIKVIFEDILYICMVEGFQVLFKPKYSLSNYKINYREFLENLKNKYKEDFLIMSPYANACDIFKNADAVISIPYTSTKFFADKYNIPSIFYYPKSVEHLYNYGKYNKNLIFGRQNLQKFLANI